MRTLRAGRYTLNRTLGAGSQAETFEARDNGASPLRPVPGQLAADWERYVGRGKRGEPPSAHGLVAIKSFHVGRAKAWKDVELAEREARTLAALSHPNLPKYIEHFEEDGTLYLVMEMVHGVSLAELRKERAISSAVEVTRMLTDIGDALRYLHGRAPAVVHRDIKPGNILRRHDGSYALVDFGAVRDRLKPEGGSTVVGTFGFMAPEQFQGRASPKSDLYGLAATALVMLTGCEPEDLPHVGLGIDVRTALPSSTPPGLVNALAAMLDPDPDRRARSIDDALAHLSARPAPVPAPVVRPEKKSRNRREEKRRRQEQKRERRRLRRQRAAPLLPRVIGQLAILVARLVVALAVGAVTPLVLVLLSLVFGASLRRAAMRVRVAATHADLKMNAAAAFLGGKRQDDDAPRLRVDAADASDANAEERVRIDGNPMSVRDRESESEYEDFEESPKAPRSRGAARRS